ncbi:hypothetical protein [Fodinibius sp.]|uniref:hypothetical protein n=1 Tax=Fodinibius sp. TaxID=1872440 RepID=UPI002ACD3CD0|nr:hypothetical protein [Fodinibius sp.]MDZ7658035.1 hypothetical protein [Fodinibius sp.]
MEVKIEQPDVDDRESIDIGMDEQPVKTESETTNGSSEQQGSTERKNDVENDTASPDPEPTTQGGVADNDERETIKAEVNELGKQVFGNTKWYSHSKAMAANVDENAEGIHQLDIEGLRTRQAPTPT